MVCRLGENGLAEDRCELLLSRAPPQRASQVDLVIAKEAETQLAIGAQANAVAQLAVGVAKGPHPPPRPLPPGDPPITRRPVARWPATRLKLAELLSHAVENLRRR